MKDNITYLTARAEDGIEITGYTGWGQVLNVPHEIHHEKVRRIGTYAFSDREAHRDGKGAREIRLPDGIRSVGNYAFYGCRDLEKLEFTDSLEDIGGGAFTVCAPRRLKIIMNRGEKSCLRDLLSEIRQEVEVTLLFPDGMTRLLFPEHYEEAVENTPARIVMTEYHGSGGNYRQCFYDRKLDFKKYDDLFPLAEARENEETLIRLAALRLDTPFRMTEYSAERYKLYLTLHLCKAAETAVKEECIWMIRLLAREKLWTAEDISHAIDLAVKEQKTAVQSVLMEEQHLLFPVRRKTFEL